MRNLLFLLFASSLTAASGCVNREPEIPVTVHNSGLPVKESGALYLWPPYTSAAVIDKEGNRCVLAASGAKTANANSEAAFKFSKALEGLDLSAKQTLVETFTKLSAADSHAAFADVALFHLCLLDQNGTFSYQKDPVKADKVMAAYYMTIEAAKALGEPKDVGFK